MARTTLLCTGLALSAFAANSLLCRAALVANTIDPVTFTSVRLGSGAVALWLLANATRGASPLRAGSWRGAAALFGYAIAFSFAYVRIGAGVGALIAFGAVQVTMLTVARLRGERWAVAQVCGLLLAAAGLLWLLLPGATAPDPLGAAAMALAGACWGVYSLLGRKSTDPLAGTAGNFLRTLPLTVVASALAVADAHASTRGLVLATVSGALTSGVGYAIWYTALRGLTATTAAVAQLSVPVLAAFGGAVLLGEAPSLRLVTAAVAVLGGIALAVPRARPAPGVTDR